MVLLVLGGHAVSQTQGEASLERADFWTSAVEKNIFWAVRSAEFCCECHKGKDSQGSY